MGLSLLSLPPLISSVKLFYSFECVQNNKEWSNVHNFSYSSSVKGWPVGLIKRDQLHSITKKQRTITFKVHIEILKLYDDQNQEIPPRFHHRFIVDNTNTIHNFQFHSFSADHGFNAQHQGHVLNGPQSGISVDSHHHHHNPSGASFLSTIHKDIEISKLSQRILSLHQTVDSMKKELCALRSGSDPSNASNGSNGSNPPSGCKHHHHHNHNGTVPGPPPMPIRKPKSKPPRSRRRADRDKYQRSLPSLAPTEQKVNESDTMKSLPPRSGRSPFEVPSSYNAVNAAHTPPRGHFDGSSRKHQRSQTARSFAKRRHPRSISNVDQLPGHFHGYDYSGNPGTTQSTHRGNGPASRHKAYYPGNNSRSVDIDLDRDHVFNPKSRPRHQAQCSPHRSNGSHGEHLQHRVRHNGAHSQHHNSPHFGRNSQRQQRPHRSERPVHSRSVQQRVGDRESTKYVKHRKRQRSPRLQAHQRQHEHRYQEDPEERLSDIHEHHGAGSNDNGHGVDGLDIDEKERVDVGGQYKSWYHPSFKDDHAKRIKNRKKSDAVFASHLRSFVEVDNVVHDDLMVCMETNDDVIEWEEHPPPPPPPQPAATTASTAAAVGVVAVNAAPAVSPDINGVDPMLNVMPYDHDENHRGDHRPIPNMEYEESGRRGSVEYDDDDDDRGGVDDEDERRRGFFKESRSTIQIQDSVETDTMDLEHSANLHPDDSEAKEGMDFATNEHLRAYQQNSNSRLSRESPVTPISPIDYVKMDSNSKSKQSKHSKHSKDSKSRSSRHRNYHHHRKSMRDKTRTFGRSLSEKQARSSSYYAVKSRSDIHDQHGHHHTEDHREFGHHHHDEDHGKNGADNLKKWLCQELGFSRRYFERFVQRGYDSIDLVIQLREDDLQRIGISSRKDRMKLLKEYVVCAFPLSLNAGESDSIYCDQIWSVPSLSIECFGSFYLKVSVEKCSIIIVAQKKWLAMGLKKG